MPEQLLHLDSRKSLTKALMVFSLALALVWSWFVVRWYLGNTMAEYLSAEQSNAEAARLAVRLAPQDPLTHWRLGDFIQRRLSPDQLPSAVKEYETAVSLSPNDYRFWMALGTCLEQIGEDDKAEQALRRSLALAPSYSYPRWYLGNLLLRSARYEEAFAELKQASQADSNLRPQLFNLAWEVYNKDPNALKVAVGNEAEVRAQFSLYLVGRQRFEQGVELWNGLSVEEKRANQKNGEAVIAALIAAKHFHEAMNVWNDLAPRPAARAALGRLVDGGFEDNISSSLRAVFGWQVQSTQHAQIGIDPNQAHGGNRSLRIAFGVTTKLDSLEISQLIAVVPDTQYDLQYFVRTEKLKSAATPRVTITDATDGSILATSPAAPEATDWQAFSVNFKTGTKSQAVVMSLTRASCYESDICPIFGTVWYDDFNLQPRN
ncbi:MAG TPA: tetratricopeptide repeat protein [Pyrinomonadaceae bacterium]|nr:tetratricopeptide repeat protein [Pyrinomonadaceae bacterium]